MRLALLSMPVLLAGCAAVPPAAPPQPGSPPVVRAPVAQAIPPTLPAPPLVTGFRPPRIVPVPGVDGVIQQDGASLVRQFGDPRLDVREGDMRKLQFTGQACVLDIYLYPLSPEGEPVATYIETRRASDGQDVDRAACISALRR